MATALDQQRSSSQYAALSFDDRFGLLVETEWTAREQRKLAQRLRNAKPRYPAASLEDVDFTTPRGLARDVVLSLGTGAWIREHHNLLISGPTGIGKSWLASAFVQSGCRHGFAAAYGPCRPRGNRTRRDSHPGLDGAPDAPPTTAHRRSRVYEGRRNT